MAQSTVPYIGSKISLISNSQIRYQGILYTINTQESTIALQSVSCFGTEGRKAPEIPPSSEVYDFIIFRGQDIKDLTVLEPSSAVNDPAIVSINQKPGGGGKAASKGASGGPGGGYGSQQASGQRGGGGGGGERGGGYGGWGNSSWASWSSGYGGGGGGYGSYGSYGSYNDRGYGKGGGGSGGSGGYGRGTGGGMSKGADGGKAGKGSKGAGKAGKAAKGGSKGGGDTGKSSEGGKGRGKGGRGGRGATASGIPVGELPPEINADVKNQCAEEFDVNASNEKFDKVQTIDGVEGVEDRLKPLSGYDKSKSFFDSISCEATERAAESERQKVDREKAREFDRETFGDTRRPPRPTGGRPGKGRRRGGAKL